MDVSPPSREPEYDPKPIIITVREPKCTRCRNHGLLAKMKGHKGSCPYVMCTCMKCILVEERRRISRQQIRLRRHGHLDVQEWLESVTARTSPASPASPGQQGNNVSPNNLIQNEPNASRASMSWPVNFSVGQPQMNPSCLHSSPAQSDLSHYYSPPNAHIPAPWNANSGNSMVAENHNANHYYSPNNLSDFNPPYAHTLSGYPLAPQAAPQSNPAYKGFINIAPTSSCSRSWFFNSVSYNLNALGQGMPSSRVGSWQGPRYLANWAGGETGGGTMDYPTDLTENGSPDDCKLVIDTDK